MSRNPPHRSPSSPSRRRPRSRKAPRRPSLEALEDRTVPAHFTPNLPNLPLLDLVNQTVHSFPHTPAHQAGVHPSGGAQAAGSLGVGGPGPKSTHALFPGPAADPMTTSVSPLPAETIAKTAGVTGAMVGGTPTGTVASGDSVHLPEGSVSTAGQSSPTATDAVGLPAPGEPATPADRAGGLSATASDWLAAAFFTQPPLGVRLSGGAGAAPGPGAPHFAEAARVTGEGLGAGLLASFTQGGDTLDDLADEQIKDLLASDPGPDPAWGVEPLSALDLSAALLTGGRPRADILAPAGPHVHPVVTLLGREQGADKVGDEPAPGGERLCADLLIRVPGVGGEEDPEVAPNATGPQAPPPPSAARRAVHAVALTAALLVGLALCARRDRGCADPRRRPACRCAPGLPGLPGRVQPAPSA